MIYAVRKGVRRVLPLGSACSNVVVVVLLLVVGGGVVKFCWWWGCRVGGVLVCVCVVCVWLVIRVVFFVCGSWCILLGGC